MEQLQPEWRPEQEHCSPLLMQSGVPARRYHMQVAKGESTGERPMWAEKGGLDFEGRAKWDAWTACKGVKAPKAKLEFVRVRVLPHSVYVGYALCFAGVVIMCAHHHQAC